jgi:hypothetical protein
MRARRAPEKTFEEFAGETPKFFRKRFEALAARHGSSLREVFTYGNREGKTVRARGACFHFLWLSGKSQVEIARMFGRNEATVSRALRTYMKKFVTGGRQEE